MTQDNTIDSFDAMLQDLQNMGEPINLESLQTQPILTKEVEPVQSSQTIPVEIEKNNITTKLKEKVKTIIENKVNSKEETIIINESEFTLTPKRYKLFIEIIKWLSDSFESLVIKNGIIRCNSNSSSEFIYLNLKDLIPGDITIDGLMKKKDQLSLPIMMEGGDVNFKIGKKFLTIKSNAAVFNYSNPREDLICNKFQSEEKFEPFIMKEENIIFKKHLDYNLIKSIISLTNSFSVTMINFNFKNGKGKIFIQSSDKVNFVDLGTLTLENNEASKTYSEDAKVFSLDARIFSLLKLCSSCDLYIYEKNSGSTRNPAAKIKLNLDLIKEGEDQLSDLKSIESEIYIAAVKCK